MPPTPTQSQSQAGNLAVNFNDLSPAEQEEVIEHAEEILPEVRAFSVHGGELRGRNDRNQLVVTTVAFVRQSLAAQQAAAAPAKPTVLTITGGSVQVAENEQASLAPSANPDLEEEQKTITEAAGFVS